MEGEIQSRLSAGNGSVTHKVGPLAYLYIAEVFALGGIALALAVSSLDTVTQDWPAMAVLALGVAAAQLFTLTAANQQTYRPSLAFLMAAVVLLTPSQVALLVIVSFVVEAVRGGRPWHVWGFDLASALIATRAAGLIYHCANGSALGPVLPLSTSFALLAAGATLISLQRLLLRALTGLLAAASGQSPSLLTAEGILVDIGLVSIGSMMALLWQHSPWLILLGLPPLVVVGYCLRVPVLKEEASLDGKTSLLNSRTFETQAKRELERASRLGQSVALIMADLDYLREVNNKYGHLAGDMVLQRVASIIKTSLPENGFAGRFGGEEFSILISNADVREGLALAELIRARVAAEKIAIPTKGEPVSVTMSFGVATYPYNGSALASVLHAADAAVYRAKMSGRNRVCVALLDCTNLARHSVGLYKTQAQAAEQACVRPNETAPLATSPAPAVGRPDEEHGERSLTRRLYDLHVGIVSFAGPALAAYLVVSNPAAAPWEGLALFTVLALVAEAAAVDKYDQGKLSTSFIVMLAAAFAFGVPGVVLTASSIALLQGIGRRNSSRSIAFEFGALVLAGIVASLIFHALARPLTFADMAYLAPLAVAAGMASYLVNTVLVAQAIGLGQRRQTWTVWQELFRWLAGHSLLMSVLAVFLAAAYTSFGVHALIAFAIPALAMRYAFKQYTDRTTNSERELAKANQHLRSTYENTLLALVAALDARDHETEGHSERVANYAVRIAEAVGLDGQSLTDLRLGALLHDIGKIGLPDSILRKQGPLNDCEWQLMHDHPRTGLTILQGIEFLGVPSQIVVHHHERFDGQGYPLGLSGEEIPLLARIFAVADAFDALTSDRPYRPAQNKAAAMEEIQRCAGAQFDPAVVAAFVKAFTTAGESEAAQRAAQPTPAWRAALQPAVVPAGGRPASLAG